MHDWEWELCGKTDYNSIFDQLLNKHEMLLPVAIILLSCETSGNINFNEVCYHL